MPLRPAGLISREEPIAKRSPAIDESLAAVDPLAEVGHQIAERSRLPALVERLEALRDAVGRRGDLVGVDGVELARVLVPGSLGSQKISAVPRMRRHPPWSAIIV